MGFADKGFYNFFNKTTLIIIAISKGIVNMLMTAPFMPLFLLFSLKNQVGREGKMNDEVK
jgi:hypothetical protein